MNTQMNDMYDDRTVTSFLSKEERDAFKYMAEKFVDIYVVSENHAATWVLQQGLAKDDRKILRRFVRDEFIKRGWEFPDGS